MTLQSIKISVTEFKAKCLKLIDDVEHGRTEVIITKRRRPIAKLVRCDAKPRSVFGHMAGTFTIDGDIISPIDVIWNAEHE